MEVIDVEIKINKKVIITFIIAFALCISCFLAGRFIRLERISGIGEQLIDGIELERDTTNQILDELNIERNLIESEVDIGSVIIDSIRETRSANQLGTICIDAIRESIARDIEFNKNLQATGDGFYDAAEHALNLAIERADLYERIISTYEQANRDFGKDNKESE